MRPQMLFDHFNQTLFRLIEEEPGFHDELKYFRERKARMSEICRLHARMDGRLHRARIEEKRDIGEQDRMCHLVLLESQGFSKHFKWREGGDPIDIECRTQGYPHKTAVLARIDGVADGVVANLLLNTGIHHDLALSIPRSPITEGRTDVRAQFLTPKSRGGRNPAPINVLIGRTDAVLNMTTAAKFTAPNPKSFALVRDPAARFVDLWRELGMDAMLDGATMEDYLSDPNAFRNSMPEAARLRLHEGMARSLGYTGDVDTNMPIGKAQRAATSVARGFTLGLIAEHWFESLVYLRRLLCWSQREVEYIAHPSNPNAPAGAAVDVMFGPPQTAISDELRSKILAVNRVDAALYKHFNTTLWRGLEREAQMREEIDMTKAHLQHVLDTCEPLLHMMEAEIAELAENGSGSERRCARMLVPVDVLSRIAQKRKSSRWSYE
ncbi:hypothetical protein PTSG_10580 [Salpingoeca rosetta]|uniref:Sulfotransferase domain-containing protein n=1 Tax=Salpingoeca rosetta (strain ATCC 50818 / BSB-021) TaxID=946362 RepID=F2URS0_SALR5|nr:uncharacterized protein PTSG_10580 [Salpingoeca rosetta]EGD80325.1 hypothetical protein PTSG_10580 [Salpingoeca rosetta]|eukprot:XP_004988115.1 hypothetical protein PTSG_10580 [Salpingoeca rosetta]